MDAIYRVGLALQPAWNAVVGVTQYGPALHVFGVAADTCPPGTYLKTAPRTEARLAPPSTDSRLSDLYLLQRGGSAIELSTQFQSNTTLYGAMVPSVRTSCPCTALLQLHLHDCTCHCLLSRPGAVVWTYRHSSYKTALSWRLCSKLHRYMSYMLALYS